MPSEQARHWGTIGLGIVTIATAAIGVALFGSDILDANIPNADPQVVTFLLGVKYGAAIFAGSFYVGILFDASRVIVPKPERLQSDGSAISQQVLRIYAYLVSELLALLLLLIADLMLNFLPQPAMQAEPAALLFTA